MIWIFLLVFGFMIYSSFSREIFRQIGGANGGALGQPCSWGKPCGRYKKGRTNEQLLCQGEPEVCLLPEKSECSFDSDCGFKNGFKMTCRGVCGL